MEHKKQVKKYILLSLVLAVTALLAVMPMLASRSGSQDNSEGSLLSAQAEPGDITLQIRGGGQLAGEAAVKLEIPAEVKLTEYLVGNGDTVAQGDPVARVDRVSVMSAIAAVQETLDTLSGDIAAAAKEEAPTAVKSQVGGTVKEIYAQPGDSVLDVMLEYGALAAISLDGKMAADISVRSDLKPGQQVTVGFSQGETVQGRVSKNLEGVLTVTVEDKGYCVDEPVTVMTSEGELLGSGRLYINSRWNASAWSGTVSSLSVAPGAKVYSGQTVIRLEDTGYSPEFQRLIDKRQSYEELMQELFQMYRTNVLAAPCGGIVSGVETDGAFLLSSGEGSWAVRLLSNLTRSGGNTFRAYGVSVTEATGSGTVLSVSGRMQQVEDLSCLEGLWTDPGSKGQRLEYAGQLPVYVQTEDGILRADGTARAGDLLLAVGDSEGLMWFVRTDGQAEETGWGISRLSSDESKPAPQVRLTLSNTVGTVGQPFEATLSASLSDKPLEGSWSLDYSASPGWLRLEGDTLSGIPEKEGSYTLSLAFQPEDSQEVLTQSLTVTVSAAPTVGYTGVIAKVVGISDGVLLVKQAEETFAVGDLEELPQQVIPQEETLTEPASYLSNLIKSKDIAEDEILLLVTDEAQVLVAYENLSRKEAAPGENGGKPGGMGGMGGMSGGMPGMTGQEEDDGLYTLEKLTVASVTSQEHMTVSVTVDELDITGLSVGQQAAVRVDALGGEVFEASITGISNSGENSGGNSKFSVEVTLSRSGEMLPGMYCSVDIPLEERQNVLRIPVAALEKAGAHTVVYTGCDPESGALLNPVTVTLGASDGEYAEVLSGLEPGQSVYYIYYDVYAQEREAPAGPGMFP